MSQASSIRCAWTIMAGIWRRNQWAVLGLLAAALLFGSLLRSAFSTESIKTAGTFGMGLSLFLTFIICGFTEGDRKARSWGFPARLFTLPVSTSTLVAAPMLFGVLAIGGVYLAWAGVALSAQGLPLTWPLLYLGVGMICYQCILWSMARYRVTRIIVLGYTGALFAMGWMAFRTGGADASLDWNLSDATRRMLCWMLAAMAAIAYGIAWIVVGALRRGGFGNWWLARRDKATANAAFSDPANDASQARRASPDAKTERTSFERRRFRSAADAQFWFEWRRHGKLLPLATASVLFLIMAPAPFAAPVSSEMTALALCWIVVTPLLIAFVLGKGLGKPDLWAGDSERSLFLSSRPLSSAQCIGAKIKMGAVAALAAWALVIAATPGWLWLWCDWSQLAGGWTMLGQTCTPIQLYGSAAVVLLILIFLTFRFLTGSLYLGLSGKQWVMNLAACGVFTAIFGGIFGALAISQHPVDLRWVVDQRGTIAVGLLLVFAMKVAATLLLVRHSCRNRWLTVAAACRYGVLWMMATGGLVIGIWVLPPIDERWKWLLTGLVLFTLPMLRMSIAPLALASSFRH